MDKILLSFSTFLWPVTNYVTCRASKLLDLSSAPAQFKKNSFRPVIMEDANLQVRVRG